MKRIAVYILVFLTIGSVRNFSQTKIRSTGGFIRRISMIIPVFELQPIYMGPIFGYSRNYLTDVIKSSTALAVPNIDLPKSGNGYNLGLSYEEHLGEPAYSTSSIIFNLN